MPNIINAEDWLKNTPQAAFWRSFASRSLAESATVPDLIPSITVISPDESRLLSYVRAASPAGAALLTNGGSVGWVPDGDVTPQHFGALCTDSGDDAIGIAAAVNWLHAAGGGTIRYFGQIRMETCVEMKSNVSHDFGDASLKVSPNIGRSPSGSVTVDGKTISYNAAHDVFYARGAVNIYIWGGKVLDASAQNMWLSASRLFDFIGCRDYSITGVTAIVPGAFVASRFGRRYSVFLNSISVTAFDGVGHHDGIIDQWLACNNFEISSNEIRGNGVAKWPILVTGTGSDGVTPEKCFNFLIRGNRVSGCVEPGIFVMGRTGFCDAFSVTDNLISATQKEGIIVADCLAGTVTGNITRQTGGIGILLRSESVPAYGDNGARHIYVGGNIVENANTAGITNAFNGCAIGILSDSQRIQLVGNIVKGSSHTYALYINGAEDGEAYISVLGGSYPAGTQGDVAWASDPSMSFAMYGDNTGLLRLRATAGIRLDGLLTRINTTTTRFGPLLPTIWETGAGGEAGRVAGANIGLVITGVPGPYADDAASATAGVPVGGLYRKTGGTISWRQT